MPDGLRGYCKECYRAFSADPARRDRHNKMNNSSRQLRHAERSRDPEYLEKCLEYTRRRSRAYRASKGNAYRAYTKARYHALYAPGAPRHQKRPTWKPKTPEQIERRRLSNIRGRRQYYADPAKRALHLLYTRREDVRQRINERIRQRAKEEPGYAMKRNEYKKLRRQQSPVVAKREDARILVNIMLRHGWMRRGACADCGTTERVEGHHHDYDKPLEVMWLCRRDHMKRHRENFATANGTQSSE